MFVTCSFKLLLSNQKNISWNIFSLSYRYLNVTYVRIIIMPAIPDKSEQLFAYIIHVINY